MCTVCRLLNVIAMAGTLYTAVYIWAASAKHGFTHGAADLAPYDFQSFFTGDQHAWPYDH